MTSNNKVLVTGVSGFVAAHVLDQLLKKGYSVRGTVRSQKKADQIKAQYPQHQDKLEFVFVEDVAKEGAFAGTIDASITGIFHVASPFHFNVTRSNKEDLLDPALKGTLGVLEEAAKFPNVKRVVITSSFAAIEDMAKPHEYVFSEEDWNPITWEEALTCDPVTAYLASKKLAEKAAYDFVKEKKPTFDIATICPPMVYGPIVHQINKLDELGESIKLFYDFVSGKKKVEVPGFDIYVDVRDLAAAHILAFENPQASNQRYLTTNKNYDWQEVVDFVHKNFPNQTKADVGNPGTHPAKHFLANNSKSIDQLGLKYTPKEDTYRDLVSQLLQFEKEGK